MQTDNWGGGGFAGLYSNQGSEQHPLHLGLGYHSVGTYLALVLPGLRCSYIAMINRWPWHSKHHPPKSPTQASGFLHPFHDRCIALGPTTVCSCSWHRQYAIHRHMGTWKFPQSYFKSQCLDMQIMESVLRNFQVALTLEEVIFKSRFVTTLA